MKFFKMDGAGNDFVLIDQRAEGRDEVFSSTWISRLLDRHRGVGADGLLVLHSSAKSDLRTEVSYWNSDGHPAEFCGNGARCVAAFLSTTDTPANPGPESVRSPSTLRYRLGSVTVEAVAVGTGRFSILHPIPQKMEWPDGAAPRSLQREGSGYDAGVPHWVLPVDDLAGFDLETWGRSIRLHPDFEPHGTNADAVEIQRDTVHVRTYERGVEGETLACGSGLLASAWWAHSERGLAWPIRLQSQSGERFLAHADGKGLWLEGPAHLVYEGQLESSSLFDG